MKMTCLRNRIKALWALIAIGFGLTGFSASPTVTAVTAQQRYPWNGLVDIVVTINGAEVGIVVSLI